MVTYNVENLFDHQWQGTEYTDFSRDNWGLLEYDYRLDNIAKVLDRLNADIIALQEVENSRVVADLLERMQNGNEYAFVCLNNSRYSAVQSALLSRYPIVSSKGHTLGKLPGSRIILEVSIDISTYEQDSPDTLVVFVNHWKSRRGAAEVVEEHHRRSWTLISNRLKRVSETIKDSSDVMAAVLGDFNEDILMVRKRVENAEGWSLLTGSSSTTEAVESGKIGSYNFRGKWETIDGIFLLSSNEAPLSLSTHVFSESWLLLRAQKPFSSKDSVKYGFSDHLPVVADFSALTLEAD